jgi:DNA-binding GntR family transcriptional regulator
MIEISSKTNLLEQKSYKYSLQDVDRLRQMDDQFHDAIYVLSGRTVICDTLLPLHRKTMRYRRISIQDSDRLSRSIQEHKAICNAICEGDAELAETLMSQHIQNAKDNMIERLQYHG